MLKLENICFEADGKQIIKDLSTEVSDGLVAVTGPNGGGKSTLAKLIMGIEKPTSGKISYNDIDITQMSVTERARLGIGYAFQQPVRFKGLRVRDLLAIAVGSNVNCDMCCVLSEVGLCAHDYLDRELNSTLSGGEMKRIEIAMTLARNTSLSVFDEPEAGIDLWSFQNLVGVFESMRRKKGNSIIVITHQERILDIADRILYLKGGTIEADGSRNTILPVLLKNKKAAPCGLCREDAKEAQC